MNATMQSDRWVGWVVSWLALSAGVWLAAFLVNGVWVGGLVSALAVGALLKLVNTYVKPVLVLIAMPLTVLTFGLFLVVINAALLIMTAWLSDYLSFVQFGIRGIVSAVFGAVVISVVTIVADRMIDADKIARTLHQRI